jgi:plastocyanin
MGRRICVLVLLVCASVSAAQAQATVRGRIELEGTRHSRKAALPTTVVWLTPLGGTGEVRKPDPATGFRLVQKNKSFDPHVLVVPVGSVVEFPNHDPFFHNVFSLFEGKRFDLGLYEAGSTRMVHFDRAGVSYIFCNIHPEMSAVVITVTTPLYAVSNSAGQINIPDVPFGRYTLHIWSEHGSPEVSEIPSREITISEDSPSLGVIRVPAPNTQTLAHKNKYGRDYDEPTPDNPVYRQQR